MKKKKRLPKYMLGGTTKIENPNTALMENQKMMLNADRAVADNPWTKIIDMVGNMAIATGSSMVSQGLSQGFGDGSFAKGDMGSFNTGVGGSLKASNGTRVAAMGGRVNGNVEVEGKEVAETPDGTLLDFKGPSHENGGIDINLPEGTEIFSKRIKVEGKTMAERKKAREAKMSKLEKLLEKNGSDKVLKDTIAKTKSNHELEEMKDQKIQEIISVMKQAAGKVYAYGTGETGIQFPNFTSGDLLGMAGTLYSAFAPMENTREQRAGDTPNINAFENYGKDALETIDRSTDYVASQRDNALMEIEKARTTATAKNRNNARGINTMRALDISSNQAANDAEVDVFDNFAKQMIGILSQKAGLENQQDQVVMGGEQARDLADRQDRDNYYSQMAQDIATKGQGIQTLGKMLNENKANTIAENAINDSSVNFKYQNGVLTDKAGNPVMTQAEIESAAAKMGIPTDKYIEMYLTIKNQ